MNFKSIISILFFVASVSAPQQHSLAQNTPLSTNNTETETTETETTETETTETDTTETDTTETETTETETTETETTETETTETTSSQTTPAAQPASAIAGSGLTSLAAVGLSLAVAGGGAGGGGGGGGSVADGTYRNTVSGSYLTEYNYQSMLSSINPLSLNDYGYTGLGVKVAVVDTGIDSNHSEFNGRTIYGYDYTGSTTGYGADENGHGSHVASILAGDRDATGMRGVAYDATLYDYKWLNSAASVSITDSNMATLYNRHVTDNIAVSNNSWGVDTAVTAVTSSWVSSSYPSTIAALKAAQANGTLFVFAAGNGAGGSSGSTQPELLAALPYHDSALAGAWLTVVAVNSSKYETRYTDRCGVAADFCVAAPGGGDSAASDGILAAQANGSYARMSGTSQAAPHVAGLAAALMEKFPSLTSTQIAARIKTTASYDGVYRFDGVAASTLSVSDRQAIFGHGFINSTAAAASIGNYIYANGNDLTKGTNLSTTRLSLPLGLSASTQSQILNSDFIVFDSFDGARFSVSGKEVFEATATSTAPSLSGVKITDTQHDSSFGYIDNGVQVKPSEWAPRFIKSGDSKLMTATGTFWGEKASLFSQLDMLQSQPSTNFIWERFIGELSIQPFAQILNTGSPDQSIGAYGASFSMNMNKSLKAVAGFKTSNPIFENGILPGSVSQGKLRDLEIGFAQNIGKNANIFLHATKSDVADMSATSHSFGFSDTSADGWTFGYETQSEIGTFVLGIAQPNQMSNGKASLITPTGRTKSGQILYKTSEFEVSRDKNLERFIAYQYANDNLAISFGVVEDRYNYGKLGAAKLDFSLQF